MIRYIATKELLLSSDNVEKVFYGIKAVDENGFEIIKLQRLPLEEDIIEELCRSLTAERVLPIHLKDIVDDLLWVKINSEEYGKSNGKK